MESILKRIIEYLLLSGFVYHTDNDIYNGVTNYSIFTKTYNNGQINVEVETRGENSFIISTYVFPHVGMSTVKHFVPLGKADVVAQLKEFLYSIENEYKFKGIT